MRLHLADLTLVEEEALSSYKSASENDDGQSRCFELNRMLEHGLFPEDLGSLAELAGTLDGIFGRCPTLVEPITVYRAIGLRLHYPLHRQNAQFRNLSYWSTSAIRKVAISFLKAEMEDASGALLKLQLPAGLPAYDMETLLGAGGHEAEILLPRGIMWTVGKATFLDMDAEGMLAHAKSKFRNIIEVELTASTGPRAR